MNSAITSLSAALSPPPPLAPRSRYTRPPLSQGVRLYIVRVYDVRAEAQSRWVRGSASRDSWGLQWRRRDLARRNLLAPLDAARVAGEENSHVTFPIPVKAGIRHFALLAVHERVAESQGLARPRVEHGLAHREHGLARRWRRCIAAHLRGRLWVATVP